MIRRVVVTLVVLLGTNAAMAQGSESPVASPPSTMQLTIVGTSLRGADGRIYVNEACWIFPGLKFPITGKKLPEGEWNPDICHLESVLESSRREEKPAGNQLERSDVEVREQEYVLQNITLKPQVFAVLEQVPRGWMVDSDPQPVSMEGEVAIFEVHAGPGETVRLHVGIRHSRELKPKTLPATNGP